MHEAALAQAAMPAPSIILGLPLRPYSLGHELALIREQNPLLNVPVNYLLTRVDLEEAVLICAQTFEEYSRPDWLLTFKLWLWRRRIRKYPFGRELKAFLDYRAAGILDFPLSQVVKAGRSADKPPSGAPFLIRLHQFLMLQMDKGETEAWDYPFGLAKMHWLTYLESEGAVDIYSSFDAEADAYAAAEDAKEAAELASKKEAQCRA